MSEGRREPGFLSREEARQRRGRRLAEPLQAGRDGARPAMQEAVEAAAPGRQDKVGDREARRKPCCK